MKFSGRVALVTGGARGIGRAICEYLAERGASVAVADILEETAEETVSEFRERGFEAEAVAVDVASPDGAKAAVREVLEGFSKLDILINNAGITRDTLIVRMKEKQWDQVLAVNLKGTFNMIKAAARPMMKARYGRIVNIASVVGLTGNAGQANYSASKAGVLGLTKTAARELAARNITVNAIAPGFIQTEMTRELSEEAREAFLSNIPLNRAGTAQDVAKAVCYLAGPESTYITGQVLNVDGGMVM